MCTINIFNLDLKDPRGLKPWQKCLLFVVLLVVVGVSIVTAVVVIVPTVPPQGSSTVTLRPTIGTGDTEKTKTPTVAPSRLRSSSAPTKIPTFNPTAFPTRFPTPVKRIISVQCKTGNRLDACVFTYSDGDRVTYGDEAGGNWQRKYSLGANEYIKSVEWIDYKRHFGSAITFRTNVGRTFPYAGTDSPSASGEPFGPKNGCEVSALNVVNTNGKYTLDSVDFREVT